MMDTRPRLPEVALLTGSRAFGVCQNDSDWDYVSVTPPRGNGWRWLTYNIGDGYLVYRHGNRNVIVCTSKTTFDRWMRAHRHCLIERPQRKERRKVIFDHYMYGMPLDRKTPLPRENRWWFMRRMRQ